MIAHGNLFERNIVINNLAIQASKRPVVQT